jgi:hypothetical protein
MFKVRFFRDWLNYDPKLRKKIKGLHIEIGYRCQVACYCDCASKCKYKGSWKWHNFWVEVSRFFYRKFKIHWHNPIYITRHSVDLSGTPKCPFKKERMYHCTDCKYQAGYDEYCKGLCGNPEYHNASWKESKHPTNPRICKFFEKNEWADAWDKNTGEIIYD